MSFQIYFWIWMKPDELYISAYEYRSFLISRSLQLFLIASEVRISKEYRKEQRHRKEVQMERGLHLGCIIVWKCQGDGFGPPSLLLV